MKRRAWELVWLTLLVCAGCGETTTGIAVSGTVSRGGKPLDGATILFVPQNGTKGNPVRSQIKDGLYRIAALEGLQAGHYVLEVSIVPKKAPDFVPQLDQPVKFEREIAGQNAQIDLEL
jgi:hypothetical protein